MVAGDVSNEQVNWGKSLPVQSVQELVRNDPQIIPERYIRTEDERPSSTDFSSSSLEIPVIDMSLISLSQEKSKLDMACREWGFFQMVNHGIPQSLFERMRKAVGDFFDLPLEEKKRYAQAPNNLEGYGQIYVVSEEQKLDWADMLFLNLLPEPCRNLSLWPTRPSEFRETLEEYAVHVQKVAKELLSVFAENLPFKTDLNEIFGETMAGIRMNYYPPCSRPDLVMGVSPHSDGSGITLLLQDHETEGLQIRKDENWISVRPIPNALVVNIGDALEIITNGRYKSIEHRAVTNKYKPRMSFATFYIPDIEKDIFPWPDSVDEAHPCLYRKIKYADYIRHTMSNKMDGKKKNIDFVKVEV